MTLVLAIEPRKFDRDDFDRLISWVSSPAALRDWAAMFFFHPLDHRQLRNYLQSVRSEEARRRIYTVIDTADSRVVGHIELSQIWPHLSGRISRVLVGEPRDRGKGLGSAMVRCLARQAFEEFQFDRIDLGVSDRNRAAVACYEKVGFVHVGTWPGAFQTQAGTIDVYWMTLRRADLR